MASRAAATGPPAVIVGGKVTAVPVARSLFRAGIDVQAVGEPGDPLGRSRYCSSFTAVPPGPGLAGRWIEWLLSREGGGVLMPVADDAIEAIADNRERLASHGYILFEADDQGLRIALDKDLSYGVAREAGVHCPATTTVRSRPDIARALAAGLSFPCGIKPLLGHLARAAGVTEKVIVARDAKHLEERLERLLEAGVETMVTEIVPGPDDRIVAYFTYMDEHGEPLLHFTNRKLRQMPIHFGVGCYVAEQWDAEVAAEGLKFLRAAGIRGLAHVEFKRHTGDNRLYLIECNHRFNLSIGLLYSSGLDLPLYTYRRLTGGPLPPVDRYRMGETLWHPFEDARAFVHYRRAGELTAREWLRSVARRQRFSVLSWDDPCAALFYNATTVWKLASARLAAYRKAGTVSALEDTAAKERPTAAGP